MSDVEKILNKMKTNARNIPYRDVIKVLKSFGFNEVPRGRTSGSSVAFADMDKNIISFHKPHPEKEVPIGAIVSIINHLRDYGYEV